ncbi:MAG: NAD-dependent epimerase/dehydratase family protein [Bacteroidota bacterium]
MKAFVTGGTGFVGSHLAEELVRRGYDEVRCLVRSDPKWLDGLPVETVGGDLFDAEALRRGARGADIVYHVAGLTRAETQEALDRANVAGTLNLLAAVRDAAPDVRRVLITSSLAACGPSGAQPLKEAEPLEPISRYGLSKARMEEAVQKHYAGLPVTTVRPPAVYGPREADIYTIIKAADKQRVFPVVGKGEQPQLSLVHVRDLVRGMADAAEAGKAAGETYFIGSEAYYAWNEIRDAVLGALGRRALKLNVPRALVGPVGAAVERVGGLFGQYPPLNREKAREATASWLCSVAKARRDFGYRQTVEIEDGMAETVRWYRRHGWL